MNEINIYIKSHEISEMHPSEIANILRGMDDSDINNAIKIIPKELVGDVALALPDRYFDHIVESLSVDELSEVVPELESDDQLEFMQELENVDDEVASRVFEILHEDDKKEIEQLQKYDENEAGAYMQLEVFVADEDEIVQDVIKRFARLRKENELENIQNLFVVDKNSKLLYAVGLDDLLIFDFSKTIQENIIQSDDSFEAIKAYEREDIKDVVEYFKQYDLSVLPILNDDEILLGRITSDDIYDIINEHATEQMYHLAGVDDEAEEDEDVLKAGGKRAYWLGLNLVTAVAASFVIGLFSETINSMVALAVLMPIVASMGGNAGTQTLTVIVRKLALGEISQGDAFRSIRNEISISLMNGFLFAIIMGMIAWAWFNIPMLGVIIGLSMIINLFMAGFFGAIIPLALKWLKVDPAIGSTVVLTTITDVVGFFSFLGLAKIILL